MRNGANLWMVMAALVLLAGTGSALGDAHERVRQLREQGEIVPFVEIIDRAQRAVPGQVLEAELEDEYGRLVYEVELLDSQGRVHELYFNAATGERIRSETADYGEPWEPESRQ